LKFVASQVVKVQWDRSISYDLNIGVYNDVLRIPKAIHSNIKIHAIYVCMIEAER
jgi:hypothetical protein